MEDDSIEVVVKNLHSDLIAKYKKHKAAIEQYWRIFDRSQRTQCIRAGAAEGVVLKHRMDQSMGNVCKFVPEINLRGLADPKSDLALDLLKHRATNTLLDQYKIGLNSGPGDHAFMQEMMQTRNLRLVNSYEDGVTLFLDEDRYGQSMTILHNTSEVLAELALALSTNLCVPQELGQMILLRQFHTLQFLNLLIEDILDIGSRTRREEKPVKRSDKVAIDALSKLKIQEPAKSVSVPDLINSAAEQEATLMDQLTILTTEPVVLAHAVNFNFFSRAELLPDEKGRTLPVHTDKYISGAVLETVHNAVKALAFWTYINRLLNLWNSQHPTDKVYRAVILQEISNVCHLEYNRAQALFKRNVQTATGAQWFHRISNAYDKSGNARVAMRGDPRVLTRADPQLHYMLRLCQLETDAVKATNWIKMLSELHQAHPSEREKLCEREADSFGDLAVITSFMQDLRPAISIPSLSRKKNQMFVAGSRNLDRKQMNSSQRLI